MSYRYCDACRSKCRESAICRVTVAAPLQEDDDEDDGTARDAWATPVPFDHVAVDHHYCPLCAALGPQAPSQYVQRRDRWRRVLEAWGAWTWRVIWGWIP
jgi:hypothetical protein